MKTFRNACFLSILIETFAPTFLQAQTEAWERINPVPVESSLYDCNLLPNNRIVAVGSNATVVYSDNFGADWEIIYTPDNISRRVNFISVDFADESHGMAVGNYFSIIKTDDGGKTWTDISPGANLPYYDYKDVCYSGLANCFVTGVRNGNYFLLHSSDGGTLWDTAFQSSEETFEQVQFVDENTGFLSGGDGNYFFKSADGGENWELISVDPGIENLNIGTIYFSTVDNGLVPGAVGGTNWHAILLKTIDGGLTWSEVNTDFRGGSKFFFINPDTGITICGASWYSNYISKTIDGGESWEIISENLGDWFLNGICMNIEGKGIIIGDAGQIYKSADFGNSWQAAFINSYPKYKIDKTFITGDSTILANLWGGTGGVTDFKTIESFDRGANWAEAPFEDGVSDLCYLNNSVAFYTSCYSDLEGGVYKSVDGGDSWDFYKLEEYDFQPLFIDFIDDQTGFVGGKWDVYSFRMYQTHNQGETWTQAFSDVFNTVDCYYPPDLEFKDDSTGYLVGAIGNNGNQCNIIVTHDKGNTWKIDTLPFNYRFNGIHFINPDTGFLYGIGKIARTINGGHDWSLTTINSEDYLDFVSMSFPTDQTGYAINADEKSNQSIFKTIDGGDTWNNIDPPTSSYILSVNFFTENEGVILGDNALIFTTQTGGLVGVPDPQTNPMPESPWRCYPNPFATNTTISSLKDISGDIVIRIFDFTGRPVRYYSALSAGKGETFFNWDGRDDQGNEISPGIYIIGINYASSRVIMKVVKF